MLKGYCSLMWVFIAETGLLLNAEAFCIKMNRQRDMEVHYGTGGCPYSTPESFATFYDGIGIDHGNTSYTQPYPMNEQVPWIIA